MDQRSHLSRPRAGVGPELGSRAERTGGAALLQLCPPGTGGAERKRTAARRGGGAHLERGGCAAEVEGVGEVVWEAGAKKLERTGTGSQVGRRWGVQSRRRGKRLQKQG